MSIFGHNIYENIRTRTIVLYEGYVLLIPAGQINRANTGEETIWRLPGGGLERDESLAECAQREILEETGIDVRVGRIAFLREWVVPRHAPALEPDNSGVGCGFGLEVFHYATPVEPVPAPRPEHLGAPLARWIPLTEVPTLPVWPKELKDLCRRLDVGAAPEGCISVIGQLDEPHARAPQDPWQPCGEAVV
jgi:ADP-ribose pyrophosphatase YjhB (NUDIX family)